MAMNEQEKKNCRAAQGFLIPCRRYNVGYENQRIVCVDTFGSPYGTDFSLSDACEVLGVDATEMRELFGGGPGTYTNNFSPKQKQTMARLLGRQVIFAAQLTSDPITLRESEEVFVP